MPRPTEPCSNWRQMKVATVCTPTGATSSDATSSREATAKTSSMEATRLGAISGSRMRRKATMPVAPHTRAAASRLSPIWCSAAVV